MSLLLGLVFGMTMFTACGGGDDDDDNTASTNTNNGGSNGSSGIATPFGGTIEGPIEGVWYLKSEDWIHYTKGGEIYVKEGEGHKVKTYDDYNQNVTLTISKSGDKYSMEYVEYVEYVDKNKTHTLPLTQVGEYDFRASMKYDGQRIVIISSTANSLTVGWYEDYDRSGEGKSREYGKLIFMR